MPPMPFSSVQNHPLILLLHYPEIKVSEVAVIWESVSSNSTSAWDTVLPPQRNVS